MAIVCKPNEIRKSVIDRFGHRMDLCVPKPMPSNVTHSAFTPQGTNAVRQIDPNIVLATLPSFSGAVPTPNLPPDISSPANNPNATDFGQANGGPAPFPPSVDVDLDGSFLIGHRNVSVSQEVSDKANQHFMILGACAVVAAGAIYFMVKR